MTCLDGSKGNVLQFRDTKRMTQDFLCCRLSVINIVKKLKLNSQLAEFILETNYLSQTDNPSLV